MGKAADVVKERYVEEDRFIRREEVKRSTGLSDFGIAVGIEQGTFPKPIRLGDHPTAKAQAWIESEINDWKRRMIERSRDPNIELPKAKAGPGRGHKKAPEPAKIGRPVGSRNKVKRRTRKEEEMEAREAG